jgi:hypothetical protein
MKSFFSLLTRSEGSVSINGETTVGFSFKTMFQHTGFAQEFLSKETM